MGKKFMHAEPEEVAAVENDITEEIHEEVEAIAEEAEDAEDAEVALPETTVMLRDACVAVKQLNMRKEPKANADVVCVINDLTPIKVDLDKSTMDFFYVIVGDDKAIEYKKSSLEGYCMKKFIEVV